ncbi:MAG: lytic transglycosylase domain-containing protein [Alphaproteobacteria bacterium]
MKFVPRIALICAALVFACPAQAAQIPGVLSDQDVRTYRAIFQAQRAGNIANAKDLAGELKDKSLLGYVLAHCYLEAPNYKTSFSDLKSWLDNYADLPYATRIHKLALKRRPSRKAHVPAPRTAFWRPSGGEAAVGEPPMQTELGVRMQAQIRVHVRAGDPDAANAVLTALVAGPSITQADVDRLATYVAQSYLAEVRDSDALRLAGEVAERGRINAPHADWVAGLAAYRLREFARAGAHFEKMAQASNLPSYTYAAAAFWAARSYQRAGDANRIVPLYAKAASEPDTFYGLLAGHVLGQDKRRNLVEPSFDSSSFAALMRNAPAHRAVALSQIGEDRYISEELHRAYAALHAGHAAALAALARAFGEAAVELKAAKIAARRGVHLTSLYPVPSFAPSDGYKVDTALILAFARQESGFDGGAVSRAGARGVMQVMPSTAALIEGNKKLAGKHKNKLDEPEYNMALGQRYMRDLLSRQNGNLFMVAAAYNGGPGNLSRWLTLHEGNDDPLLFVESVPLSETRRYIKQVMLNLWMYAHRFGKNDESLEAVAAGRWPVYSEYAKIAALD